MKKIISSIGAIALCGAMLTACGKENETAQAEVTETTTTAAETTVEETAAEEKETEAETTAAETTAAETAAEETTAESAAEETTTAETTAAETTAATTAAPENDAQETAAEGDEIVMDDGVDTEPVSSEFSDMDAFLEGDIFSLSGKSVTADKTLSAAAIAAIDSGKFSIEMSDFDGSNPIEAAFNGSKVMVRQKNDDMTMEIIIRDSKVYTMDHENKVALFLPSDKEIVSHYSPEGMGIAPKNIGKAKFVIADVTIGGKAYKFEYSTEADWGKLYSGDKLYASVQSGDSFGYSLYKWNVSGKIPSGTFDIPEDYFQLDMEEMMQNMPAEE